MKYQCYTDGSSRGNPGSGGWASIIMSEVSVAEFNGHKKIATNNQMEMMGVINVFKNLLEEVKIGDTIEIYSDSQYVVKGCNDWMKGWIKNNWKNSQKKEVINKELWQEINAFKEKFSQKKVIVKLIHVYGHKGHKYNERADQLCTGAALGNNVSLYSGAIDGYEAFLSI